MPPLSSALISQHLSSIPQFDEWCQEGIQMLYHQLTDLIERNHIHVCLSGCNSIRLVLKDHPLIHHFFDKGIEDTLCPFPQDWHFTITISTRLNSEDNQLLREYVHECIEYTICKMIDAFHRKLYHSSDWKADMVAWFHQHIDLQTIENPNSSSRENNQEDMRRRPSPISSSDMYQEEDDDDEDY